MQTERVIVSGVSGRYASALFELALERGVLDSVAAELESLAAMMADSPDLTRLIRSPIYGRDAQNAGLQAILKQAGMSVLLQNFLGVVIDNRRLFVLAEMIEGFGRLLAERRGEIAAEVISAFPLTAEQMSNLEQRLHENLGRSVRMTTNIDEDLLGGLIVKVGSIMIDSSLATKIRNLETAMKEVG